MRLPCWLRHRWSTWTDLRQGKIVVVPDCPSCDHGSRLIGYAVTQERRCAACGRLEQRMVRTTIFDGAQP